MSETRVNMRKIVGLTDDLARLAPQGDRPRIGMGIGVAYAAGYHAGNDGGLGSLGGKGELGERDADAGRDDGPVPRDAGDGMHDAAEALPPTGEVPGLGGLYDCDSGRCVNVRFDGIVPPPDGWEDACAPQRDRSQYDKVMRVVVEVQGYFSGTTAQTLERKTVYVWDVADYASALAALDAKINRATQARYPGWPENFRWGSASHQIPPGMSHPAALKNSMLDALKSTAHSQMSIVYDQEKYYIGGGWYGVATVMYAVTLHYPGSVEFETAPINIDWPAAQCSEVAYDAATAQFKDGTCGNDPLMPLHLQGQYSGFELCDKDGNKVRVKRTRYGIEVGQEAHGRVTTLDPDTFKVVHQSVK